jgi:hypothetical protein
VPYLFSTAVLGLAGLAGLLFGTFSTTIALATPIFGAATAVTAVSSTSVRWRSDRQRRHLRRLYPLSVLTVGIAVDDITVPVILVIGLGLPAVSLLLRWYFLERRRSAALAAEGTYTYTHTGC